VRCGNYSTPTTHAGRAAHWDTVYDIKGEGGISHAAAARRPPRSGGTRRGAEDWAGATGRPLKEGT
jgi:hypothetical protein